MKTSQHNRAEILNLMLSTITQKGIMIIFFLFSFLIFSKCVHIKKAKTIRFVARENPREVIDKVVNYEILDLDHSVLTSGQSNELGYFELGRSELSDQLKIEEENIFKKIIVKVKSDEDEAEIYLNDYIDFYDVYLSSDYAKIKEDEKIADMHYHISMRSHNKFAYQFHEKGEGEEMPTNINWDKSYKKMKVLYKGRWKRPKFSFSNEKEKDIMRELFSSSLIKNKEGANSLKIYSQATLPNTVEGNVFLGFNAISPFEYNVSKTPLKRVISSSFKSGVPIEWLQVMGKDKEDHLTHWENFNIEYQMINSQDRSFNNFEWKIYEKKSDLENPIHPIIVNVVEGGHILQDRYFPHFVEYDITQKHSKNKTELFEKILITAQKEPKDNWTLDYWEKINNEVVQQHLDTLDLMENRKGKLTSYHGEKYRNPDKREVFLTYSEKKNEAMDKFITGVLMRELNANIDTLKEFTNIQMMAIGHLAYNGMTGHALAIDVSKKPPLEWLVSQVVKRAYRTKSSSDENYRKSFNGLFFTIPGVNKYGENVITRLLDDDSLRRIQIDLKHSDVQTREFVLNQYKKLGLPPICSHCAVTGISKNFNSPVVDEYSLLKSSLARKFYPFSINLYNEEITKICKAGGIIGIPLEERVLGRYVDNRVEYPIKIKLSNPPKLLPKVNRKKRINYTEKGIKYLKISNNPEFDTAAREYLKKFTSDINFDKAEGYDRLPKRQRKQFYNVFLEDYLSAEAFLQNLFHIVDLTHLAVKDSLEFDESYLQIYSQNSAISQKSILSGVRRVLPVDQEDLLRRSWRNICLGSDLDGLIDPLNICPTASDYPTFKRKLKLFIPLFLKMRKTFEQRDNVYGEYRIYQDYFNDSFTLNDALNLVFFQNLVSFTKENF